MPHGMEVILPTEDDGSGSWTIIHPSLGALYTLHLMPYNDGEPGFNLTLYDDRNNTVVDADSLGEDDGNTQG